MADMVDVHCVPLYVEQDSVDVRPAAVKELSHLERKPLVFRSQATSLGKMREGLDGLFQIEEPAATVDAPHGVQKEDEKPPQGNELKAPFGELVGTGRRQMAARADCGRAVGRSHGHFDTLLVGTEVGVLVDKTSETMAAV